MRLVGLRSFLPLLSTLPLACAAPSPGAPDQARDAAAPTGALQQAATPIAPSDEIQAEPEAGEAPPAEAEERKGSSMAADDALSPPPAPEPGGGGGIDRSQSRLDIAVPSINGGLNRDIIRRIASDHADDIRDCHGRALASIPGLAGKLVVHVELDANGEVREAKLGEDSSLANRDVESCVLALIQGWSFSDAGGKGSADLAFEF